MLLVVQRREEVLSILYKLKINLPYIKSNKIMKGCNSKIFKFCCNHNDRIDSLLNAVIPLYYKLSLKNRIGINTDVAFENEVVISLTSFPGRIDKLWICIESLLRQKVKPNKIILWLAQSQFENSILPNRLMEQTKRGLEIRFCDDLVAYKKFYYTFKEFPDSKIITVDDDVIYPNWLVKDLVKTHNNFPNDICCYRAHEITLDSEVNMLPYMKWNRSSNTGFDQSSHNIVATGIGGILYPPNVFCEEVLNRAVFMEIAPFADDLWLKAMAIISNIRIRRVTEYSCEWTIIEGTQEQALCRYNGGEGGNDIQLKNIFDYYKIKIEDFFI